MTKKDIQKELESLDSSLKMSENKGQFEPPENYFEQMQKEVMLKIKAEEDTETYSDKGKIRRFPIQWAYAAAAVFVLVLGAIFLFNQGSQSDEFLQGINDREIAAYLNENIDDISLELLAENEKGIATLPDQNEEKEIQEYLEENLEDIDLEDLENIL